MPIIMLCNWISVGGSFLPSNEARRDEDNQDRSGRWHKCSVGECTMCLHSIARMSNTQKHAVNTYYYSLASKSAIISISFGCTDSYYEINNDTVVFMNYKKQNMIENLAKIDAFCGYVFISFHGYGKDSVPFFRLHSFFFSLVLTFSHQMSLAFSFLHLLMYYRQNEYRITSIITVTRMGWEKSYRAGIRNSY